MPPTAPASESTDESSLPLGTVLRRLLGVAMDHRRAVPPVIAVTVVAQILTLASIAGQGLAIDLIRSEATVDAPPPTWPFGIEPPETWPFIGRVAAGGAAILLLALLAGGARFAQRVVDEWFAMRCVVDLRMRLYRKLQRLDFGYFDGHDTGQIINRFTTDVQSVRAMIQGVMTRLVVAAIALAIFMTFMLREHALLTLACVVAMPIQVLVMARYGRVTKPRFKEQAELLDVVVHRLQESIAGVRPIRAFGREAHQADIFDQASCAARDHRVDLAREQSRYIPAVQAGNYLTSAILLGYGGTLVVRGVDDGGIALGTLWIFHGLLHRLAAQVEAIVGVISQAPQAVAGAERVFRMLDEEERIVGGATALPGRLSGAIRFEGVGFAYGDGPPVLSDVSFEVAPGETVAIVGRTGAGKTTLLSLVPRFHDPTEGRILVDGVDLRDVPLEQLRAQIGFVFQEPFLFSASIEGNVAFGDLDAPERAVHGAISSAHADTFVAELEDGTATIVGERGVDLSGGQRQRLTIARALLVDPAILVLDDALTAVDPVTETGLLERLDDLRSGRTTLIVAHRLSTLRRADRVVVLEGGRVVDVGTHEELMSRGGHYRDAALIQIEHDDREAPR